jgi:serpin B
VSPYSVGVALSMIYAGARGDTETEMAGVLHADDVPGWQEGINAYDLSLDARTTGSPTSWSSANKVWTQPGLALRDGFLDVLTGVYGSPLAEADFAADPDGGRKAINAWVEEQTDHRIPELFPADSIEAATVMVLVNAVALDAPWEFPFDPAATSEAPFTRPDGSSVLVATMHYDEFLPSVSTPEYQAVELPYSGGTLSMIVIMPTDLTAFEADLTTAKLEGVFESITDGGIHLSIPKWSTRTHLTLNDTLSALGMPSAFGGRADFSGMVDGGGIWLDRVEHEAYVEVDERGTRAAAATGGSMAGSHGPTITVDRPYLYVVRDQGAGTNLFIGRVTDPSITP